MVTASLAKDNRKTGDKVPAGLYSSLYMAHVTPRFTPRCCRAMRTSVFGVAVIVVNVS